MPLLSSSMLILGKRAPPYRAVIQIFPRRLFETVENQAENFKIFDPIHATPALQKRPTVTDTIMAGVLRDRAQATVICLKVQGVKR